MEASGLHGDSKELRQLEEALGMRSRPRIVCADGLSMSVQANAMAYCWPRQARGPYESVEVGFPSMLVEELMPWAEDPSSPTSTVYARVPVAEVASVVAARGGRAPRGARGPAPSAPAPAPASLGGDPSLASLGLAWRNWAQQAVLGSSEEEIQARFEISEPGAQAPWVGWPVLMLLAAAKPREGEDPYEGWARACIERLGLEKAARRAQPSRGGPKRV